MAVNKNLFLYDLAIVAIMKNEEPYVKEWLDYHLLAGVNHFFIFNNGDSEEFQKILQPYIDKKIVTLLPDDYRKGQQAQLSQYNDAIKKYKFFCRYMAFVDCDEFIFPKSKPTIVEVLDEILSEDPKAEGLGINWHCFGSNFQEKADLSRGVLERFTRRAPTEWGYIDNETEQLYGNWHIKTIANPRKVRVEHIHGAIFFEDCHAVNEKGKPLETIFTNIPPSAEKIIVNHYYCKSLEEVKKRRSATGDNYLIYDKNEIFDDGILKYRDMRKNFLNLSEENFFEKISELNQIDYNKIFNSLLQNLVPTFPKNVPKEFLENKIETFLTCLNLSKHLKETLLDETAGNFFEETALNAIYKTVAASKISFPDSLFLLSELPNILQLNFPAVKNILKICLEIIQHIKNMYRPLFFKYQDYYELDYIERLLKIFESK